MSQQIPDPRPVPVRSRPQMFGVLAVVVLLAIVVFAWIASTRDAVREPDAPAATTPDPAPADPAVDPAPVTPTQPTDPEAEGAAPATPAPATPAPAPGTTTPPATAP